MALDYGDARTGVAISDGGGILAGETSVIPSWNHQKLLEETLRLASDREVDVIALGLPRNMDGSEGPRAEKSRAFAAELEASGLKVVFVDERRTTVEAGNILFESGKRGKKRRERIDAVAATLILETYLNSLH